jgi:hypothetical protein
MSARYEAGSYKARGAAPESYKLIAEENKELGRSLDKLLESFRGAVEEACAHDAFTPLTVKLPCALASPGFARDPRIRLATTQGIVANTRKVQERKSLWKRKISARAPGEA